MGDKELREWLMVNMPKLAAHNQRIIKLMYGRDKGKRSVAEAEAMTIEAVIAEIPDSSLNWAVQQTKAELERAC